MIVRRLFWTGLFVILVLVAVVARYDWVWLEVVVGAVISIWITALFEAIRKPDLEIKLHRGGAPQPFRAGTHSGYVLSLHLVNRPLEGFLADLLERNPATETSGTISFRQLDTNEQIGEPMSIRWSNTPQPWYRIVQYTTAGKQPMTIENRERLTTVRDVPPDRGEEGVLGVTARFDGESECYGVTNESYDTDWHPTKWRLGRGKYLVEVKISASNARCEGTFILVNGATLPEEFRLELPRNRGNAIFG